MEETTNNQVTVEEIKDFIKEHLDSKPELFWAEIYEMTAKEAFEYGLLEGMINALVNGGVEVIGLKNYDEIDSDIKND